MNKFFSVIFKILLTIAMVSVGRYLIIDYLVEKTEHRLKSPIQTIVRESQESQIKNKFINENPDIFDMPPWEHENKWNRISNSKLTCWYHKKSKKKICKEQGES